MNIRVVLVCCVIGCGAVAAAPGFHVDDKEPEAVFAQGRALLQKGDFDGALRAFTEATRLAPENKGYRQQAGLVRRVIKIRAGLDKIEEGERWERTARALHIYYHRNRIYAEALALDQRVHERLNNAESATMLARTQLVLKLNSDVVGLLARFEKTQVTPEIKVLLGLALARQGKVDEAKTLAATVEMPKEPAAELAFDFARLRALIGEEKDTVELLARCFKSTPPSRLAAAKVAARECPDFAAMTNSDVFAAALMTESQVKESSCSSGTTCGKCPSRDKCAGADKKEDGGKKP